MAAAGESSPFICTICYNSKDKRQPRVLPCQHSFCSECLIRWHEQRQRERQCGRNEVECPICRTKAKLPTGGVSKLPMDINIQQFADYITEEENIMLCKFCKSKKAIMSCVTCASLLCAACGDKHTDVPLFSTHTVTRGVCELHGTAIQYVCVTCSAGICVRCIHSDVHKKHDIKDYLPGLHELKGQIKVNTTTLKELIQTSKMELAQKEKGFMDIVCENGIDRKIKQMTREFNRITKAVKDHAMSHRAAAEDIVKTEQRTERAAAAIACADQILQNEETEMLEKMKSAEMPCESLCDSLRSSVDSVPYPECLALENCRIDNAEKVLEALQGCKLVCTLPCTNTRPPSKATPVEILDIQCGEGCDIENPWRLCGTLEGDVIVCNSKGGPVYKVDKNGTKTRLHADGRAAYVHDGDVYVISTKRGDVTQIRQEGGTINHKIKNVIANPQGIAVSGDSVFILSQRSIFRQSLSVSDSSEILNIPGYTSFSHFLQVRHGGMTKLVISDSQKHEVIICDEDGTVLTKLGGGGKPDGLLYRPAGIGRMSNGHLLVADRLNHRIVEYKMDGSFVRNLLTGKQGLRYPADIVCKYPYLWIAENCGQSSLKLFKFCD